MILKTDNKSWTQRAKSRKLTSLLRTRQRSVDDRLSRCLCLHQYQRVIHLSLTLGLKIRLKYITRDQREETRKSCMQLRCAL